MSFIGYEACPECRLNGRDTRGDNLGCYSDGSKHCFACGYHVSGRSFTQLVAPSKLIKKTHPLDFQRQVPTEALKWLLQYGLPYSYWKDYIGWSEGSQRLVLEIGSPVAFSIGRYFGNEIQRKWKVWGNSHTTAHLIGHGDILVLVEDPISSHKVGSITEAMSLFGTEVHPAHIKKINKPVVLWLDKDQEHLVKSKAFRLQALTGFPVRTIVTDNDPKKLSFQQIKEVLNE